MPRPPRLPASKSRRGLSPSDMTVIDNVARLFKDHALIAGNQSELARRAGLDQSYIGKLIRAETSISVTSLHSLAKALDLEPWALLVPGDWPLSNPPVLQPLTDTEKRLYVAMKAAVSEAAKHPK